MKRNYPGLFVTLEGGEKLGKSTQAQALAQLLQTEGYAVVLTYEPGGTKFGDELRKLTKNPGYPLSKAAEMLLYAAARAQHYKEVLKPALREGKIVISDRYFDSTLVYQGHGQGWSLPLLYRIHNATTGMLLPDLTFIFDGEPLQPLGGDIMENRGLEFHQHIRNSYLHLAQTHRRYVVIDAHTPSAALTKQLYARVVDLWTTKSRH